MKTIEISTREMVVSILYHWLAIILTIALFAAIFGAQGYLSQKNLLMEHEQKLLAAQAEAQHSIVDLDMRKNIAIEYQNNPMSLSCTSEANVTYIRFRILTDSTIDIYKVAREYMSHYKDASLRSVLINTLPLRFDEKFLRKLVVLNEEYGGSYNASDPAGMSIRAFGNKYIDSSTLAKALYNYLVDKEAAVALAAGQNILSIVEEKNVSAIDSDMNQELVRVLMAQLDAERNSNLVTNVDAKAATELITEEDEETTVEINSIEDLVAWYDGEIKRIEDGIVSLRQKKPDIIVGTITNSGIGAAIGFVISLLIALIGYFVKLPVLVPELPQRQLGVRYLGGIRCKRGAFIARLGDKLAGDFLLSTDVKGMISLVAANIDELISDNSKILLTGSLPSAIISEFTQSLKETGEMKNAEFVVADNVNKSAYAIRKLSDTDSVILVERLRVSTLRQIKQEQDRISFSGKQILGYVLY